MKDLTKDSVTYHLLSLAAPVVISLLVHIAYHVVDLYFVTRIGTVAVAGVNAAGNTGFIVSALTQMLTVGTMALISHAVGRNDRADARLLFNQSILLSGIVGAAVLLLFYPLTPTYLRFVAADAATIAAGQAFLHSILPGFVLSIPSAALAAALIGTGRINPPIAIYAITVVINIVLAPVLIVGWGTGVALGVQGAGLATSLSIAAGIVMFVLYFLFSERYLAFSWRLLFPRIRQWRRILDVGVPAALEFTLLFLSTGIVYYLIRSFGASAQAGFGIGSRVLQVIMLPGIAIGSAVGPIAGQNFGARNSERVRRVFRDATLLGALTMAVTTILVQWRPNAFVSVFDADAAAVAVAVLFLQMMSWTSVLQGMICVCSSMFQGLGNTLPSLISSGARFATFSIAALWLLDQPAFGIEQVWYVFMVSIMAQAIVSLWLLHVEFKRRLLPLRT